MQCSERFYKTEVEDDINSGHSPNQKEKEKMLRLLKNFEDESLKQVDLQEGREDQDIAERLGNLDLGERRSFPTTRSISIICRFNVS